MPSPPTCCVVPGWASDALWQLSSDLVAACDAGGRVVALNPAGERVLARPCAEVCGVEAETLVHADDVAAARAVAEAAWAAPGTARSVELRVVRSAGGSRRLSLTALADGAHLVWVGRDQSASTPATREARREVEHDLRSAYKATGFVPWRWDVLHDEFEFPIFGDHPAAPVAGDRHSTLHAILADVPEPDRSEVEERLRGLVFGGEERLRFRYPVEADGQIYHREVRCSVVRDDRDRVIAVHGGTHDVTESERARRKLKRTLDFTTATLDSLDGRIAVLDADGVIVSTNLSWRDYAEQYGAPSDGDDYLAFLDASAAGGATAASGVAGGLRDVLSGRSERFEGDALPAPNDEDRFFDVRGVRHADGTETRIVLRALEVTDRVRADRRQRMTASLLDRVGAAVIATDLEGRIIQWNEGATQTYGWTAEEARGQNIAITLAPEHHADGPEVMAELLREGHWQAEVTMIRRDGSTFDGSTSSAVYRDERGKPVGLIGVSLDITERKTHEQNLRAARDYFKAVTDSMADGLMTLDEKARPTYVNPAAERLLGWSAEELIGQTFQGLSVPEETERCNHDTLRRRMGGELPVARVSTPLLDETGQRGAVVVFRDISQQLLRQRDLEQQVADLSLLDEIRQAIDQDRFVLHAQPIVDLETGATAHHELLLRMVGPDGTLIAPGSFLPVAEAHGAIVDIDRWVIRHACELAAGGMPLALNLSAQSFGSSDLLATFATALRETGASPSSLLLELTETAVLHGGEEAAAFVVAAAEMGMKIALDDFGTGYGGFSYLKHLCVHCLKIDIEFVRDIGTDPASRRVVEAVVGLARGFGLRTVAEGVEDVQTIGLLRHLGVDLVQGYGLGRPGPV